MPLLYCSPEAEVFRKRLDTVIFDMDGVLLDITGSIRAVNCLAVPFYLREVLGWKSSDAILTSADIEMFKHVGGFNDDWDLTHALTLLYLTKGLTSRIKDADELNTISPTLAEYADSIPNLRVESPGAGAKDKGIFPAERLCFELLSGAQREELAPLYSKDIIRQVYQELLAGDQCQRLYGFDAQYYHGRGFVYQDKCLLDHSLMPKGKKIGMQTGRTYEEAVIGREICKLEAVLRDEVCITKRDGFHKPEPGGLIKLAERLGAQTGGIYIGDTLDDLRTVRNLNHTGKALEFIGALVLTGPAGKTNEPLFREAGADLIADDVNDILKWINQG